MFVEVRQIREYYADCIEDRPLLGSGILLVASFALSLCGFWWLAITCLFIVAPWVAVGILINPWKDFDFRVFHAIFLAGVATSVATAFGLFFGAGLHDLGMVALQAITL